MTTVVNSVWLAAKHELSARKLAAAAAATVTDPLAVKEPTIGTPTAPVAGAAPAAAPVTTPAAKFQSGIKDIGEGRANMYSFAVPGDIGDLVKQDKFSDLGLDKLFPGGLDKASPQQVAQQLRQWNALKLSKDQLGKYWETPLYKNPVEGGANITAEDYGRLLEERAASFADKDREAYAAVYRPGSIGKAESAMEGIANLSAAFGAGEGGPTKQIQKAIQERRASFDKHLKAVEADPKATGFTDWFTSSWANMAVPAGFLLMLFGGDTGMLLGGLAVAAGGYDLYNRHQTLTKDPIAQKAAAYFADNGFSRDALAHIEKTWGQRYTQAALDFKAAAQYGFLSNVQGAFSDAGVAAFKARNPRATPQQIEGFRRSLPKANTDENPLIADWFGKGSKLVGDLFSGPKK